MKRILNWLAGVFGYVTKDIDEDLLVVCRKQQAIIDRLIQNGSNKSVLRLPDLENPDEYRAHLAEMFALYQNEHLRAMFFQQERALLHKFRNDPSRENSDIYKGGLVVLEGMRNEIAGGAKQYLAIAQSESNG